MSASAIRFVSFFAVKISFIVNSEHSPDHKKSDRMCPVNTRFTALRDNQRGDVLFTWSTGQIVLIRALLSPAARA